VKTAEAAETNEATEATETAADASPPTRSAGPPPLVVEEDAPVLDEPPPLVVDENAPLLLDGVDPAAGSHEMADNSACFVCHVNYDEEPFALWHAKADVGCVKCHGDSFAHRNDEDNTTPPDKMYPADRIERLCDKCHETHDAPAARVITRWQKRCPEKTDPSTIVCTDCHGQHRLAVRTVKWNKKTGELIKD
jgi:hypothetical protein